MKINYVKGDATTYNPNKKSIIAHICNVQGGWGSGFVLALSKKWDKPEQAYRNIKNYTLGTIQPVQVEENLYVMNMMAQNGFLKRTQDGYNGVTKSHPLDMEALETCLQKLDIWAKENNCEIQMPQIGAGLGGGDWVKISELIENTLTVPTTVYLFN